MSNEFADRADFEHQWQQFEAEFRRFEGEKAAHAAVTLGAVGLVVLGLVFGPWALTKVWQAEGLGVRTTLGELLGWFAALVGMLQVLVFAFVVL